MGWVQNYEPLGGLWGSAALAALPIAALLVALGVARRSAHASAALGLGTALAVALAVYRMPVDLLASSTLLGLVFGLWPIAWIAFNAVYFHNVTVATGRFESIRAALAGFSPDRRIQALLIAFGFGALLEGVAGGGSPIAITAAMMAALGFQPVKAVVLALLANTAPVAFGGLGNPLIVLGTVAGPLMDMEPATATELFSAMTGRQVPLLSLIVPGFMMVVLAGWRRAWEVWPAVLVTGGGFAAMQFVVANFVSPSLVDVVAALTAMGALWALMRVWQPPSVWRFEGEESAPDGGSPAAGTAGTSPAHTGIRAWTPYLILVAVILVSRIGSLFPALPAWANVTAWLQSATLEIPWPGLHERVVRVAPITSPDAPYPAVLTIDLLYSAGSVALMAAVIAGLVMRATPAVLARVYWQTFVQMRWALATIMMILAIAHVMNYSGATSTLGLALAQTGFLFPFFAAFVGWLGVFLTGSDASSNSLFGPMQVVSAQQLGVDPILAGAANTSGGVMGKMISPQNLSVGATAIGQTGRESALLRQTFGWSVALTAVVGLITLAQAHLFTWMIPG
ncbi:L-lactate permease [Marinitenerispora sediminis]|uniref:L-lactate permease n=1 Tax=Marinitenerispora sediminis TaxID=1931232 RepID=A0A368T6A0_9ACTN|nr:lactate permease LctP family transporter [Marinitenerispora sediminis]RCV49064.1 lactate transporter [Marinitenerispora sediminis]RCV51777.1 lactate transporter [Marinitenerispora sediminis]RCV59243.1 lactate transporter [Marinitenerispora sediminis]